MTDLHAAIAAALDREQAHAEAALTTVDYECKPIHPPTARPGCPLRRGGEPMTADDRTHYEGDGCPEHPARVHEPTMFCDGGPRCPGYPYAWWATHAPQERTP